MQRVVGDFAIGSQTQTQGTVISALIPPWRGPNGSPPFSYKVTGGRPNWTSPGAYTYVNQIVYASAGTVHDVVVMRPFNWAVVNGDVAHNATVVNLLTDPGAYSTAFKYGLPGDAGGVVANTADNGIAASDYVAVQLRDGTWHMSLVSSVSSLAVTLTTATPNVSGGGIEDGSILFFFGAPANTNPQTGQAHVKFTTVASTRVLLFDSGSSGIGSLNPGDPLIVYSANATAAGILHSVTGQYRRAG